MYGHTMLRYHNMVSNKGVLFTEPYSFSVNIKRFVGKFFAQASIGKEITNSSFNVYPAIGFGSSSLQVQINAYIDTGDRSEFLMIQQELNLRIMVMVKELGSDFAFPTMTTYLSKDIRPEPVIGSTP